MSSYTPDSPSRTPGCDLESVIATWELAHRENRPANREAENRMELELTKALAKSPADFYQKLVDTALELTLADSSGISLLDQERGRFVWPAVAGGLTPFIWEGTPSDFGPCGTVLEHDDVILFSHPERHYTYLQPIQPPLEEVLLVPFHIDGKAVGTIWAVIHNPEKKFQAEDRRVLTNLSNFAATAYQVLASVGAIESILTTPERRAAESAA